MMFLLATLALVAQQAVPAPDHAARVDRLLAALPPSTRPQENRGETPADAEETTRLVAANPDKAGAIRAAIAARVACVDKTSNDFPLRALRKSADQLSDAELDKLTEFYSGPEYARLLGEGDKADMTPFLSRYPLARFMEVTRKVMADAPAAMFAEYDACQAQAKVSLAAAGVKN